MKDVSDALKNLHSNLADLRISRTRIGSSVSIAYETSEKEICMRYVIGIPFMIEMLLTLK